MIAWAFCFLLKVRQYLPCNIISSFPFPSFSQIHFHPYSYCSCLGKVLLPTQDQARFVCQRKTISSHHPCNSTYVMLDTFSCFGYLFQIFIPHLFAATSCPWSPVTNLISFCVALIFLAWIAHFVFEGMWVCLLNFSFLVKQLRTWAALLILVLPLACWQTHFDTDQCPFQLDPVSPCACNGK